MFHHGEILDAICMLCGGAVGLAADASNTSLLTVGSNRLFAVGDRVRVSDRATAPQERTVAAITGLDTVALDAPVSGPYLVAEGGRVQLVSEGLPELSWIGHGTLEAAVRPPVRRYPCAVVRPVALDQPRGEGTNRALTQDYLTSVYYLRAQVQGEDEEASFLAQVGRLFDVLMRDPYLGGKCWYSQVTKVDLCTSDEAAVRAGGNPARVARLDVVARRSEMGRRD